MKAIIRKIIQS